MKVWLLHGAPHMYILHTLVLFCACLLLQGSFTAESAQTSCSMHWIPRNQVGYTAEQNQKALRAQAV